MFTLEASIYENNRAANQFNDFISDWPSTSQPDARSTPTRVKLQENLELVQFYQSTNKYKCNFGFTIYLKKGKKKNSYTT